MEVRLELDGRDDEEVRACIFFENGDILDVASDAYCFVDEETLEVSISQSELPDAPEVGKLQIDWWGGVTRVEFHIDE